MITTARGARERIAALEAAGEGLRRRPVEEVVTALAAACARWSDRADPDRQAGEAALAERAGVPREAAGRVLDAAFPAWTGDSLCGWLAAELGDARTLDTFVSLGGARRRAIGPRLTVALSAYGVPTTPVSDVLACLLVKSPVWIKPASGADDLAARFAATLREVDAGLGAAVETAGWPASSEAADAVLAAADTVVATGRRETLAALERVVGPETRLVMHGPRLSAALLMKEALNDGGGRALQALADDVAFAGQTGCLSPVVAYVEGAPAVVAALVEPLQDALQARWPAATRTAGTTAERAAFGEWMARADLETAAGTGAGWRGDASAAWTVQARSRAEAPAPAPVPRLLVLAPVEEAMWVAELCGRRRGTVATVGIAGSRERTEPLAAALAEAGVERIAPLGRMQRPPADWRRDGRATLGDLVRWVDREP